MSDTQRRLFTRIRFHSAASLSMDGQAMECEVLDLCLKGALLGLNADQTPTVGQACRLRLPLDEAGTAVVMEGEVVHAEDGHVGMVCRTIDLDSLTHLRKLAELNLGDDALLNREFSALIAR